MKRKEVGVIFYSRSDSGGSVLMPSLGYVVVSIVTTRSQGLVRPTIGIKPTFKLSVGVIYVCYNTSKDRNEPVARH